MSAALSSTTDGVARRTDPAVPESDIAAAPATAGCPAAPGLLEAPDVARAPGRGAVESADDVDTGSPASRRFQMRACSRSSAATRTPWPARNVMSGVPHAHELIEAMLAYDLLGFQTEEDCENFLSCVRHELDLPVHDGVILSRWGRTRAAVFPIGIDVEKFAVQAAKAVSHPDVSRLRRSLNGEKLAIGVDRMDYSKGLTNRIKAFDRMWTSQPSLARTVSLLQIATPSRGGIEAYESLQNELAKLVSDVNGRHGEVDWTPIRYLNKGFSQTVLAGLYRTAQVGVVTPLHDGMNLVAKEYVAAQNPADPGVLVLSKFAGAANELDTALLVNPHDIDGMARTIATAISMPLTERRMRWEAMMEKLCAGTIQLWFAAFVEALQESQLDKGPTERPIAEPPTLWPLRSVNTGTRYH
jgi:trehalose 6-phosphate synthase